MTPCILQEDGFRLVVHTREHPPAHVHVLKAGGELKVDLASLRVTRNIKMGLKDQLHALRLVRRHREGLLAAWEELHGLP